MQNFLQSIPTLFKDFLIQEGNLPIKGFSTDTRSLKQGELFIALTGDNFDGHLFIPDILDYVSGIVISSPITVSLPKHIYIFYVSDCLEFYQTLAKEYLLTKPHLKKIAITGSAGKTSTKEWVSLLLKQKFKTYHSYGNFNNLIGVPKSILEIREEDIAILELGTGKPGDIKTLRDIFQPNVSVVTSLGLAHIEYFTDLKHIALEKASLCQTTSICYTIQGIPLEKEIFDSFIKISPEAVFDSILNKNEQGFQLTLQGHSFFFPFFGLYNLDNFSLAVAIALQYGISAVQIASTSFLPLPSFRSKIIVKDEKKLILDCYNANPLSMKLTIESIAGFSPKPELILGDMLELGLESEKLHKELGVLLNEFDFPVIFFIGKQMLHAHKQYLHKSFFSEDLDDLIPQIKLSFKSSGYMFIKASRGMSLERIANL